MADSAAEGRRVLILAPYGRDAASVADALTRQNRDTMVCPDLRAAAHALDETVGVVLVTEEALAGDIEPLRERLIRQQAWSDIPFVLLAAHRPGRAGSVEAVHRRLPDCITNVVVLERPLGLASLDSAIASALRLRQKQFEMRDRLADLDAGRRALEASEGELRLITDALPVLIGFVDRDLRYRFANKAYADWVPFPAEEVVGRSAAEVIGPEGFAVRRDAMNRALAGETICLELPWPHADGRRRDAEIRYLPRVAADGTIDGFHTFALDITDRKLVEEQLEERVAERTAALTAEMANRAEAEAALRQSQKMEAVGQLTGGIAHDFNNMLTGVIGALDIMKRRIASGRFDDLNRFMEAAAQSAQRAAALTARLLAFSRRQSLDARPLDINALITSVEDLLRRTIRENIALRLVLDETVPHAVADANQLENAIINLAINARDAMPDGGALTVESRMVDLDAAYAAAKPDAAPGRYVVISVSDTGVGMAPDLQEKVFDPFFTTKPIGQGTGLGLSMVYGFARQSGGQVRLHSQPGVGTTVSIYLVAATAGAADAVRVSPSAAPEGSGQTVLLVEDDPAVRLLVSEVLEELSYTAIEAAESEAAIAVLASDRPIDLMISDVGLPGMNGRQLAEVARQHRPDLPILFVTGYAENAAIRAGFLGTNMAMITKPFAIEALAEKVSEMLA